jgi:AcrR family transcriptional regulator
MVMAVSPRALRSDALSSVARILEAARRVFASGDGSGTLDKIAREAGVGIATLYRHFPSRQRLADAVYEHIYTEEIEPLLARLGDSGDSGDAPRLVMLDVAERLAEVIQRERGLVASMGDMTEATSRMLGRSMELLEPVLRRAQEAGTIRADIEPADIPNILAMLVAALGVLNADQPTRRRYLAILLDAFNPPRPPGPGA